MQFTWNCPNIFFLSCYVPIFFKGNSFFLIIKITNCFNHFNALKFTKFDFSIIISNQILRFLCFKVPMLYFNGNILILYWFSIFSKYVNIIISFYFSKVQVTSLRFIRRNINIKVFHNVMKFISLLFCLVIDLCI